jgi:uncharacterized OsmC-like protein
MTITQNTNGVDTARLFQTVDAVKAAPTLANFRFRVENQWIDGGENRSTVSGFYGCGQDFQHKKPFVLVADEPELLLGNDTGANPVEYLLHALAACVTSSMVYHAAARGITVDALDCAIEGDLDLQGFLGLDSTTRPGYEQIRVTLTAAGDFDDDQFAELTSLTRFSPVRDIVTNPVPVDVQVARA